MTTHKITIAGKEDAISNIIKDIAASLPCCNDSIERVLKDKIYCEFDKLKLKRARPTRSKKIVREKKAALILEAISKTKLNGRLYNKALNECFLQAFENLAKNPTDDYIAFMFGKSTVGGNNSNNISLVFQEFLKIAENALPFMCFTANNTIGPDKKRPKKEVYSLEEAGIFRGKSKFTATVNNGIIPNKTNERFMVPGKDYGPCFIGKLLSVKHNGTDVTDKVRCYQFSKINIDLPDGSIVEVEHMAIESHWDIGMLNLLRRVKNAVFGNIQDVQKSQRLNS